MIVDAHHHLWDPAARGHTWLDGLPSLRRRFGPDDFAQASAPQGVTASILVQVLADVAETEEFLALAAASPAAGGGSERVGGARVAWTQERATREGNASSAPQASEPGGSVPVPVPVPVAGVVGWVDLCGPDVAAEIARIRKQAGGDRLAGVRHLVQDEPDPAWLDRPEVRRGLRAVGAAGLVYDLLIRPPQLPAALRLTADLDQVRFVLDHAAKPRISDGVLEPWAAMIGELAARPNVACKVSGLVTEAPVAWQPAQFAPYVDVLLASFGPGRLLFGSDWPVCLLAASYAEVIGLARDLLTPHLSPAELDAFFSGNAGSVYGLR